MINSPSKKDLSSSPFMHGIITHNPVFIGGLVIAPVILASTNLNKAFAMAFAFTLITFITILITSFVSRNIVYTIRIILYTLTAAVVYVPVSLLGSMIFKTTFTELGFIIPLLITNNIIISKTELRFFRMPKKRMILDVFTYILGFDFALIIFAFIRELISTGCIAGHLVGKSFTIPVLLYPFGGFILLGVVCAAFKKITTTDKSSEVK